MSEENKFNDKFGSYVCVGDCIRAEVEGFEVVAQIEQDSDTTPDDSEGYTVQQKIDFNNDKWFFCGVTLTIKRNGVVITPDAAALWGIDANLGENNDYLTEVANELLQEAITAGKAEFHKLIIGTDVSRAVNDLVDAYRAARERENIGWTAGADCTLQAVYDAMPELA